MTHEDIAMREYFMQHLRQSIRTEAEHRYCRECHAQLSAQSELPDHSRHDRDCLVYVSWAYLNQEYGGCEV